MLKNIISPNGHLLKTLFFGSIISFLNLFFQSYTSFYTNTAADSIQQFINNSYIARGQLISNNYLLWFWNFILNFPFFGFLLSNFVSPYLCENAGRKVYNWMFQYRFFHCLIKTTLIYTNICSLISAALTTLSIIFLIPELFLLSRIFGAAVTNINFSAFTLFVTEYPATKYRGLSVFLGGFYFNFGANMGMIFGMDWIFGRNLVALTGITLLPTFFATIFFLFIKETPKFLFLKKKDKKLALESLNFYQGNNIDYNKFISELEKEHQNDNEKYSILQLFKQIFNQKHLLLAILLSFCSLQLTVGPWPVTTTLLSKHFNIEQAQFYATICTFSSLLANILGTFLSESISRRSLLLYTGLANIFLLSFYIIFDRISLLEQTFRYGCAFCFIIYFCCFGMSLGTIPFYIAGELFPTNFRSIGQSFVFFIYYLSAFIFMLLILPLNEIIEVWSFLPLFIIPQSICLIILWLFLPEINGREVHEIVDDLKKLTKWKAKNINKNIQ
ncbi:hypothetical protein Mgra_00005062 [Meloidogyne graminicola]|uniref:Major facilitator superfamily (MFS) profile domain-containing protein n=1 Tax=Meloidogyne graminicola TaxID=189291 RepID=A0A8S9ZQ04_9BILA|nr:hypothetical protein Mgra_00005062 [Meloidogyne graminicola]